MSDLELVPVLELSIPDSEWAEEQLSVLAYGAEMRQQMAERRIQHLGQAALEKQLVRPAADNGQYGEHRGMIVYDNLRGELAGYVDLDPNIRDVGLSRAARYAGRLAGRHELVRSASGEDGSRVTAWVDSSRPGWLDELSQAYDLASRDPRPYHSGNTLSLRAMEPFARSRQTTDYMRAIVNAGYQIGPDGTYSFGNRGNVIGRPGRLFTTG